MPSLADDIVAIQQVLARYTLALDARRADLIVDCFTDDGMMQIGEVYVLPAKDFAALSMESLPAFGATQHMLGLPLIHVDGDRAWSRCHYMAQHIKDEASPRAFMIGGWYHDELVRTDKGWRIAHRRGCPLWADGNEAILDGRFPAGAMPKGPEHAAPFWIDDAAIAPSGPSPAPAHHSGE